MFKKTTKLAGCLGILFFLCTIAVFGQCKEEMRNGEKVIVCDISESNPFPLGPVRVPNKSKVIIRMIDKSPFDECVLTEIKLTPIIEPDPIEKMLAIFSKAFGGLVAGAPGLEQNPNVIPRIYPIPTTLAQKLYDMTKQLKEDVRAAESNSKVTRDRQEALLGELKLFIKYAPRKDTEFNNSRLIDGNNIKSGPVLIGDLSTEIQKPDSVNYELNLSKYNSIRKQTEGLNDLLVSDILADLDEINVKLTKLKSRVDASDGALAIFKSANQTLTGVQASLGGGKNPFTQEFPSYLPYTQQNAQRTVVCTNTFTKKAVFDPVPIAFLFKSDNPITVSVGPLFSTSPKQKLGITQINTGLNTMGQPSFRNEFAVVDKASYQVIPFSFINYRLMYFGSSSNFTKPPDFSLNISAGIGINPNSGTNEVEYFIGPSVGYKRFFFQFGDHIGRFQKGFTGGFKIGDTVPASFPATLPIQKEYRHRFSIGISYRLF